MSNPLIKLARPSVGADTSSEEGDPVPRHETFMQGFWKSLAITCMVGVITIPLFRAAQKYP